MCGSAQVDFDEYQDCTSCDIECERRHYFMQGFRMGYEAGRGRSTASWKT